MADDQPRVPQRVQDYLGHDLGVRAALVVVQEQQIDVGLRIQLAASVAAARDDREALIELGKAPPVLGVGVAVERAQQIVDRRRVLPHDLGAAGAREVNFGQLLAHRDDIGARGPSRRARRLELAQQKVFAARVGPLAESAPAVRKTVAHRLPTAASALK